jgi:hypothetical protein
MSPKSHSNRDSGLRRVRQLNRWLLAGTLTLTAAFSALAARSFQGRTITSASAAAAAAAQAQSDAAPGLQSAAVAPSSSFANSAPVISGGS